MNEEPSKKYRIKGDITIVNARTGEKAEHKIDRTIDYDADIQEMPIVTFNAGDIIHMDNEPDENEIKRTIALVMLKALENVK